MGQKLTKGLAREALSVTVGYAIVIDVCPRHFTSAPCSGPNVFRPRLVKISGWVTSNND